MTLMEIWSQPETWISLLTLTALEIVLGIDNLVFISILSDKLPPHERGKARKVGLAFALITRVLLLFGISWVMGLNTPLFSLLGTEITGRSLITLLGGLFLIAKATFEIYESLETGEHDKNAGQGTRSFATLIVQIMLIDVVFSLDSVITAVGMVGTLSVMVAAVLISMSVMLIFANPIGDFVSDHPSMKVLALAFLILVGVMLVAESFGHHIPKGYIYFSMAFSLSVELINMKVRKNRHKPVALHKPS